MIKQIRLHKTLTGWNAQFLDGGAIRSLFGTDTIPTAFTERADSQTVLSAISKANPDFVVSIVNR